MKKSMIYVCFILTSLLLLSQYTSAENRPGCGKACDKKGGQAEQQALDPEKLKKYDAFLAETVDLRKELDEKQASFQSLMASENPDPSKIALLTQEYYQLRDFLTEKAVEAGIMPQKQGCNGCNNKSGVACGRAGAEKNNIEKTN